MHSFYESKEQLNQYLLFHFGSKKQLFKNGLDFGNDISNFPRRCVLQGLDKSSLDGNGRALDLGCSVGGSSCELSHFFKIVHGLDYSESFINAANYLKENKEHPVEILIEGNDFLKEKVYLDESINTDKIRFSVGDAMCLPNNILGYDCVLACNLICRLPDPIVLIKNFSHLVKSNGQLIITTPFTWLKEFTPPNNWLNKNHKDSFSGLKFALEEYGGFTLDYSWDIPFLIREHSRKYQYSIAKASRWIKK